jgi:hypothetical protein
MTVITARRPCTQCRSLNLWLDHNGYTHCIGCGLNNRPSANAVQTHASAARRLRSARRTRPDEPPTSPEPGAQQLPFAFGSEGP